MENSSSKAQDRLTQLLKTLGNPKTTRDARIDIYLVILRDIKKGSPEILEDLSQSAVLLHQHIKTDLKLEDTGLIQSALNLMGYLLNLESIVSSFSTAILTDILQDFCHILEASDDKSICTRVLWCLSKQKMPNDIISRELTRLLTLLSQCVVGKSFESSAVEFEAINVFQKLLNQCPERLLTNDDDWFKMVYPFVISNNIKVAERALTFLEKNLQLFKDRSENFSMSLINDLCEGLTDRLKVMFGKQRELFVLRIWSCYVTILGKNMHQGSPLTNNLFKVVEKAFKANSSEILIAAFETWKVLIDNFATSKAAILSKKRLKLLLMPLINSTSKLERNVKVEQARLKCWLHLINVIKDDINEIFEEAVSPLLSFLFSMPNLNGKSVDLSLQKTPAKMTSHKEVKPPTPQTPAACVFDQVVQNSPNGRKIHFHSIASKKIGAEMIYLLLRTTDTGDESLKLDLNFHPQSLSLENFNKSHVIFMLALQDLTLTCGKELDEKMLIAIWKCVLHYVNQTLSLDDKEKLTVTVGGILLSLQTLVEVECTSRELALIILSICYEKLSEIINQNKDLVKTDRNQYGSFQIHMLQLLFHESRFVGKEISDRFYTLHETLIHDILSGYVGKLNELQQIVQIMKSSSKSFVGSDCTQRLWITTARSLTHYISQTHDVNQGSSLQHEFGAIIEMLLFPITEFFSVSLPTDVMKNVSDCWANLFTSFVRETSLLPTIEDNQAIENLCAKLDLLIANDVISIKDNVLLEKLLRILSYVSGNLEFSDKSIENEGRWTKSRPGSHLRNSKSLVAIFEKMLKVLSIADPVKEKSTQNLASLLEMIELYFSRISGPDLITMSIEKLGTNIASLIVEEKQASTAKPHAKRGRGKSSITREHFQKVEGIFDEIYACVYERFGESLESSLLIALLPILEAGFSSERSSTRSNAIQFLNNTLKKFGNARSLLQQIGPDLLHRLPALQDENGDRALVTESDEPSSPSSSSLHSPNIRKTLTPSLRSPHKIHGSFLQKALSAERAGRSPSPGKIQPPKSPKSESRLKPVRRRLPLLLDHEDSNDFVAIPPSPKKRRLLTEHQKEVFRSKSNVPVLYNQLDQSTQELTFTEDTQRTMDANECHSPKAESHSPKAESHSPKAESHSPKAESQDDSVDCLPTTTNGTTGNSMVKQQNTGGNDDTQCKEFQNRSNVGSKRRNGKNQNSVASRIQNTRQTGKMKTRRSLRTSFKDVLDMVKYRDVIEDTDMPPLESSKSEVIEADSDIASNDDIVPSSYTPVSESDKDGLSPFKFSQSSSFAKAACIKVANSCPSDSSTLSDNGGVSDERCVIERRENPVKPKVKSPADNYLSEKVDDAQESSDVSNLTSSTIPDFIPSSQSQSDPAPVLKGLTLLTPRRSNRKVKKTEKALEAGRARRSRSKGQVNVLLKDVGDPTKIVSNAENDVEENETRDGRCVKDGEVILVPSKEPSKNHSIENSKSSHESPEVVIESSESDSKDAESRNELSEHSSQDTKGRHTDSIEDLTSASNELISLSYDEVDHGMCQMGDIIDSCFETNTDKLCEKKGKSEAAANRKQKGKSRKRKNESGDSEESNLENQPNIEKNDIVCQGSNEEKVEDESLAVNGGIVKENCEIKDQNIEKGEQERIKVQNSGKIGLNGTAMTETRSRRNKVNKDTESVDDDSNKQRSSQRRSSRRVKVDQQEPPVQDKNSKDGKENVSHGDVLPIKGQELLHSIDTKTEILPGEAISDDCDMANPIGLSEADDNRVEDNSGKEACSIRNVLVESGEPSATESISITAQSSTLITQERKSNGKVRPEKGENVMGKSSEGMTVALVDVASKIKESSCFDFDKSKKMATSDAELIRKFSTSKGESDEKDEENENDLDCSFDDSLTLSEVKKRCGARRQIAEERSAACLTEDSAEHVVERRDDQCADDGCDRSDQDKNSNVNGETGERLYSSPKKRKRIDFVDAVESETLENIFNSPDSPVAEKKCPTVLEESFGVLERTAETETGEKNIEAAGDAGQNEDDIVPRNDMGDNATMEEATGELKSDLGRVSLGQQDKSKASVETNSDCVTSVKKVELQSYPLSFVRSLDVAPSPSKTSRILRTPDSSPISGILKRRTAGQLETPSPNKSRRVSFAYPLEEKRSIANVKDSSELADVLPYNEDESHGRSTRGIRKRFTAIQKKLSSPKVLDIKGPPICPELVDCSTPVESLLPAITSGSWSLGLVNFIRSQNIRTVGHLCALSESQVKALPIRTPKVSVVKSALKKYLTTKRKDDNAKKRQNPSRINESPRTMQTPTKEDNLLVNSDDSVAGTPSRRSHVKPTSLFSGLKDSSSDKKLKNEDNEEQCATRVPMANRPESADKTSDTSILDLSAEELICNSSVDSRESPSDMEGGSKGTKEDVLQANDETDQEVKDMNNLVEERGKCLQNEAAGESAAETGPRDKAEDLITAGGMEVSLKTQERDTGVRRVGASVEEILKLSYNEVDPNPKGAIINEESTMLTDCGSEERRQLSLTKPKSCIHEEIMDTQDVSRSNNSSLLEQNGFVSDINIHTEPVIAMQDVGIDAVDNAESHDDSNMCGNQEGASNDAEKDTCLQEKGFQAAEPIGLCESSLTERTEQDLLTTDAGGKLNLEVFASSTNAPCLQAHRDTDNKGDDERTDSKFAVASPFEIGSENLCSYDAEAQELGSSNARNRDCYESIFSNNAPCKSSENSKSRSCLTDSKSIKDWNNAPVLACERQDSKKSKSNTVLSSECPVELTHVGTIRLDPVGAGPLDMNLGLHGAFSCTESAVLEGLCKGEDEKESVDVVHDADTTTLISDVEKREMASTCKSTEDSEENINISLSSKLDEIVENITRNISNSSLKESVAIHRKLSNLSKLVFDAIERKIEGHL